MMKNLILASTLEDKGYEVTFCKGKVYIRPHGSSERNDKVIGIKSEKVYKLHFEPEKAYVNKTADLGELWHMRMVHLHHGALGCLRQVVTGVPQVAADKASPCKGCALGKYARKPFQASEHRSKGVLDLVHSNVCGPMSVKSMSGFLYFVSFINDHSKKTWIYFLKTSREGRSGAQVRQRG